MKMKESCLQGHNPFPERDKSVFKPMTDPYTDPTWYEDYRRDLAQTIFNPNEFARTFVIGPNVPTSKSILGVMTRYPTTPDDLAGAMNLSVNNVVFYMTREAFVSLPYCDQYRRAGNTIFINNEKYTITRFDDDYGFIILNLRQVQGKF